MAGSAGSWVWKLHHGRPLWQKYESRFCWYSSITLLLFAPTRCDVVRPCFTWMAQPISFKLLFGLYRWPHSTRISTGNGWCHVSVTSTGGPTVATQKHGTWCKDVERKLRLCSLHVCAACNMFCRRYSIISWLLGCLASTSSTLTRQGFQMISVSWEKDKKQKWRLQSPKEMRSQCKTFMWCLCTCVAGCVLGAELEQRRISMVLLSGSILGLV